MFLDIHITRVRCGSSFLCPSILLNNVGVPVGGAAGHQLADEASQEKLNSYNGYSQGNVEQGLVSYWSVPQHVGLRPYFVGHQYNGYHPAGKKHERAQCSEKVHGFLAKAGDKGNREQVEKAVDKSRPPKF